jgi:hypothetical protein
MKIVNTSIRCGMGSSSDWDNVPGVSEENASALNEIGYTGKLRGVKTSLYEYLEKISTPKYNYSLERTGGNSMEFTDYYRVTTVIMDDAELGKDEKRISLIEDLISSHVMLRDVPYGNGDQELDPKTVREAAVEIAKELANVVNIGVNNGDIHL